MSNYEIKKIYLQLYVSHSAINVLMGGIDQFYIDISIGTMT